MKNRIVFFLAAALMICGTTAVLLAQTKTGKEKQSESSRVDLKTQTLVGKKLAKVEEGPNGKKIYRYAYRIEAKPTEKEMPQYSVDPQYNVSYKQDGFQEGDSVTLLSTNTESTTDSPVWVYDVTYVGSGARTLNFATSGSVMAATFAVANSENEEQFDGHCGLCKHTTAAQCQATNCQCRCCVDDQANCNCSGCQYRNPRCFSCPVGCTCDHCVCSCDGCLTQNPRCMVCPVGCTCDHCRCQCEQSIDHSGRCGCVLCKQKPSVCECECHKNCP